MIKFKKKSIGGTIILLMLFTSSLSVSYSFAELNGNGMEMIKVSKNMKNCKLWTILTEKMMNEKLEFQHYVLPSDLSKEDLQRMLSFEGQTSGWAYVNKTYHSGIVLFDGKTSKVGENLRGISTNDMINLEEREFDLELSEESNGFHEVMHGGEALDEDLSYRVIISGLNSETAQNIKVLQNEVLSVNSEKSNGFNHEFRN